MARMKYAERKSLVTAWERYCRTANVEPSYERFVAWLQDVKGIWLMSLDDRGEMVRKTVELERAEANAPAWPEVATAEM
jgi:hypothetical protein